MSTLEKEMAELLNRHCLENGSNTPDFILAGYLLDCLITFNSYVRQRERWYGRDPDIGPGGIRPTPPPPRTGADEEGG